LHIGNPDLFADSHLLTAEKPESECYVIDRFFGMILEWSEFRAVLDACTGSQIFSDRNQQGK